MLRSPVAAVLLALPLVSLVAPFAQAGVVEERLNNHRCKAQVIRELDAWEQTREWKKDSAGFDGVEAFKTPTREIGRWLEADFYPNGTVAAYRITPLSNWKTTFTPKRDRGCEVTRKQMAQPLDQGRMRRAFGDSDVKQLVDRNPKGVILAWSPHMPLSIEAIKESKAAADRLGVKFTAILDPKANGRLADALLRKAGITDTRYMKRMESVELIMRNMNIHYPSLVVYSGGKIKDGMLPGYTKASVYSSFIQARTRR